MKEMQTSINVEVHPDNKQVRAIIQNDETLLVFHGEVNDTDQSILTDEEGFRYKRDLSLELFPDGMFHYSLI